MVLLLLRAYLRHALAVHGCALREYMNRVGDNKAEEAEDREGDEEGDAHGEHVR